MSVPHRSRKGRSASTYPNEEPDRSKYFQPITSIKEVAQGFTSFKYNFAEEINHNGLTLLRLVPDRNTALVLGFISCVQHCFCCMKRLCK